MRLLIKITFCLAGIFLAVSSVAAVFRQDGERVDLRFRAVRTLYRSAHDVDIFVEPIDEAAHISPKIHIGNVALNDRFLDWSPHGDLIFRGVDTSTDGLYRWAWGEEITALVLDENRDGIDRMEYSPDGRWLTLAFQSVNRQLLVHLEDGFQVQINDMQDVTWSGDEEWVIYTKIINSDLVRMGLFLKKLDNSAEGTLLVELEGHLSKPVFSLDNNWVVFSWENRDGIRIGRMKRDGSEFRQLATLPEGERLESFINPYFSPDGVWVFYHTIDTSEGRRLYRVALDNRQTPLLVSDNIGFTQVSQFSPNGEWMYWLATSELGNRELYAMQVDGNSPRLITTSLAEGFEPHFVENSTRLIFKENFQSRLPDLLSVRLEDGERVVIETETAYLTQDTDIATDGQWIVMVASDDMQLYRISPDGNERLQLTVNCHCLSPLISPDGRWVAYVDRDYSSIEDWVWIVAMDGDMKRMLITQSSVIPIEWSDDSQQLMLNDRAKSQMYIIGIQTGEIQTFSSAYGNTFVSIIDPSISPPIQLPRWDRSMIIFGGLGLILVGIGAGRLRLSNQSRV